MTGLKMKVIVAGYSKTGTKSMNVALTELGYKVYDFADHFWYHGKAWEKILISGGTKDDFKQMYTNVDAVVDIPSYLFWEEIHEAFPDSKIVLTDRDEDVWIPSIVQQLESPSANIIAKVVKNICPTTRRLSKFARLYMHLAFGVRYNLLFNHSRFDTNKLILRKLYRQHYSYVKHHAPKDKLLVFNVKEGWDPLCSFLGKEAPKKPFPWKNKDGADFLAMISEHEFTKQVKKEAVYLFCIVFALISVILYHIFT